MFDPSYINIFIATGNQDKFERMKRWINMTDDTKVFSPNDLPEELKDATKLSDDEEKKLGSMQDRSICKAMKAAQALSHVKAEVIVLGLDDTGYFPFFDQYIVDLRTPPAITINDKVVVPAVQNRLHGGHLTNHYAKVVKTVSSEELMRQEMNRLGYDNLPDFNFMPVVWKFALAVASNKSFEKSKIIAEWDFTQYIKEEYIDDNTPDTGYMVGLITVNHPMKDKSNTIPVEEVPSNALSKYIDN